MSGHVYFYTHLDVPFGVVADLLQGAPGRWLPEPVVRGEGGWLVHLRADGVRGPDRAWVPALVRVGAAGGPPGSLLRSVRWSAIERDEDFPVLEGDLELGPLQGWGCQLSLMGTYRPPLSIAGGFADPARSHRIAEACVRRFILAVADRLQADALTLTGDGQDGQAGPMSSTFAEWRAGSAISMPQRSSSAETTPSASPPSARVTW